MMSTVYIGIPTRNRPDFVRSAVLSVVDQTYTNLRVLVTDNGSEPAIAQDVERFVKSLGDPRVGYVLNAVPDGERGQTLYNFSRCEEPYFMVLHDDDRLHPSLVARAVATLEADPGLAFFSCSQNLIDDRGRFMQEETARYNAWLGRTRLPGGPVENVLEVTLSGGAFSMSGTVFRYDTMAGVGFVDPDEGGFPIDMITFLRIGEAGGRGYFANEPLADYRWHTGQSRVRHQNWSFNEWMIEKYVTQLERRHFSGRPEALRRGLLSLGLCRLGLVRHVGGRARESRALFRQAVTVWPWSWRAWAYCVIAHLLPFVIAPKWGPRVTLRQQT